MWWWSNYSAAATAKGDGTCGDRSAADEGEGGGVDQARLRRRHIENPPQASPAKAIKEVDGYGTV